MAYRNPFNPRGTDYRGAQESMDRAQRDLTSALDAKGKADKQARIKKSGERSGIQKLLSAAGRAGLAYATGGTSEALGFGGVVDDVMLGTDSEGNRVRNEYGELVGAGSKIYGAMDAKKAADIAKQGLANRQQFQDRLDYADKVGGEEGAYLRAEAMDLRDRQGAQIKSAKERSTWGWDNKFDDLGLSGTQKLAYKKRQDELAKNEQAMSGREMAQGASIGRMSDYNASKDAEKQKALDEIVKANAQRRIDEMGQAPTTKEIMDKYEKDRKQSLFETRAEGGLYNLADHREANRDKIRKEKIEAISDSGPSPFNTTESKSLKHRADVDELMDGELSKEMGTTWGKGSGKTRQEIVTDWLGGGQKGSRGSYAPSWVTNRIQDDIKPADIGKTFSEKEAEKLSRKDSETSEMDRMADDAEFNERYKASKEGVRGAYNRNIPPALREQIYVEGKLKEERENERLKELLNDQGPDGDPYRKGSMMNPWESKLKKRLRNRREIDQASDAMLMESFKNIGGILA